MFLPMARLKLSYQIVFAILGIVFVTGLILTSYSLSVQKRLITNQLERKGSVLARVLSVSVMSHVLSYDFFTIKLLFDPLKEDKDVVSVSLIGSDGFVKMDSDLGNVGAPSSFRFDQDTFEAGAVLKREEYRDGLHRYRFFSPVEIDHNRIGVIHVALSDGESLRVIRVFEQRMLMLTALVLFSGVVAAYLISVQISNPVIALTEEIKRFSMKTHNPTIDENNANEVEVLTNTFHVMMEEIEDSIDFRVRNEKMAVLGHFSSVLAHEVKNPLEPIKGSAELLRLTHPDDRPTLKYTGIIQSEVSELISFVDSFLDVARGSRANMERMSVNKAIRDVVLLLDYSARKENMAIRLQLNDEVDDVLADSGMVKQVLLNVFLNAIQARRGPRGRIDVTTSQEHGDVVMSVKDYGTGIEQEVLDDVFQPFFTTKTEGSGIGLSTSKHIIGVHNGSIEMASEQGAWTEVRIRIPAYKDR